MLLIYVLQQEPQYSTKMPCCLGSDEGSMQNTPNTAAKANELEVYLLPTNGDETVHQQMRGTTCNCDCTPRNACGGRING